MLRMIITPVNVNIEFLLLIEIFPRKEVIFESFFKRIYIHKIIIFDIFLTHLKLFLDNVMCKFYIMFTIILKKIIKIKNYHNLDGKFWIQKALLNKNFRNNSF